MLQKVFLIWPLFDLVSTTLCYVISGNSAINLPGVAKMFTSRFQIVPLSLILISGTLAACSNPEIDQTRDGVNDPYETLNRATYSVNRAIDTVALRPAAQLFGAIVPKDIQPLMRNAADNLGTPKNAVNHLLQGDPKDALGSTMRFAINSTLGLGGLFDPASEFGLAANETDFGETLSIMGAQEGAYVVLPVFGPSNGRDAAGTVVDFFLDPMGQLTGSDAQIALGVRATGIIATRHQFGDTIDSILYDSADGYAQSRLLFLQNRRFSLGIADDDMGEDPFGLDTDGF
jgi:phospholipid-binding lipoprotein MlaA